MVGLFIAEKNAGGAGSGRTSAGMPAVGMLFVFLCLPAGLDAMSRVPTVYNSHPAVSHAAGQVVVRGQGRSAWEPVERGTLLLSGDVVRTGSKGRARISFMSGSMELYEGTEIHIPTTGKHERRKDIREVVVTEGRVLLDIDLKGGEGSFQYRTGNAWGQARTSLFTVSYLREGTAINIYTGEAQVSCHDGYGERISSLVMGSSVRIEEKRATGRIMRFDPRKAVEDYGKNISPMLDAGSGLPVQAMDLAVRREMDRSLDGDTQVDDENPGRQRGRS